MCQIRIAINRFLVAQQPMTYRWFSCCQRQVIFKTSGHCPGKIIMVIVINETLHDSLLGKCEADPVMSVRFLSWGHRLIKCIISVKPLPKFLFGFRPNAHTHWAVEFLTEWKPANRNNVYIHSDSYIEMKT